MIVDGGNTLWIYGGFADLTTETNDFYWGDLWSSGLNTCSSGQYRSSILVQADFANCYDIPPGKWSSNVYGGVGSIYPTFAPLASGYCQAGIVGSIGAENSVCGGALCAVNYYCPSGTGQGFEVGCPSTTISVAGSQDLINCTCSIGSGTANISDPWTCTTCSEGTYKGDTTRTACTQCPTDSYHFTTGATSISSCQCIPGLQGTPGSSACTPCASSFYKNTYGSSCVSCGSQTVSPTGSISISNCSCNIGFTGSPSVSGCTACTQDTYKSTTGSDACTPCPSTSQTNGLTGAPSVLSCSCPAGSYGPAASCSLCPLGTYKSVAIGEFQSCLSCPSGTSTLSMGSTMLSNCVAVPGYFGNDGTAAQPCAVSTYKSTYGSSSCLTCGGHTISPLASISINNCSCLAGFTGSPSVSGCTECGTNTYKNTTGSDACTPCPSTSTTAGLTGSTSVASCSCPAGSYGPALSCSLCGLGTYQSSNVGEYASCISCPGNTTTQTTGATIITQCVAIPGFTGVDGSDATPCAGSTYKSTYGSAGCTACPSNSTTGGVLASISIDACICKRGYYGGATISQGVCQACPMDTYQDNRAATQCQSCPLFATTSGATAATTLTACQCQKGTFDSTGTLSCSYCGVGTFKSSDGNQACSLCPTGSTTLTQGSITLTQCVAPPGFEGGDGSTASPCALGYYKDIYGSSACQKCRDQSTTLSVGSTSVDDCLCVSGFGGISTGQPCVACAIDTYKSTTANIYCSSCPAYTGTNYATGETTINSCVCVPGSYGIAGQACQACGNSKYSSAIGASSCQTCPLRSGHLLLGQTSITSCQCDQGWTGSSGVCSICGIGTYKSITGPSSCIR
jgi:hypothetical protein